MVSHGYGNRGGIAGRELTSLWLYLDAQLTSRPCDVDARVAGANPLVHRIGAPDAAGVDEYDGHLCPGEERLGHGQPNDRLAAADDQAPLCQHRFTLDRHPRFRPWKGRDELHRHRIANGQVRPLDVHTQSNRIVDPRCPVTTDHVTTHPRRERSTSLVRAREYDLVPPGQARS